MLSGFSRVSLAALLSVSFFYADAQFNETAAESVQRNFNKNNIPQNKTQKRSSQPRSLFNFGSGSSESQADTVSAPEPDTGSSSSSAATTLPFGLNNPFSSRETPTLIDKLSPRTQVFAASRSVAPILNTRSEAALENAITTYEDIARNGGWGTVKASKSLRKGGKGRAVETVRRRLAAEGYLPRSAAQGKTYDKRVAQAVAGYQENNGLKITGRVDKATAKAMSVPVEARLQAMRANLIRLPEYTKDLGTRYVLVNIPSARLQAVKGSRVVSSHTVIVGKPERPSPIVTSTISEINFNPYWHSPKSIVKKDIVPEVRKSRGYLQKMEIRVFDGYNGPEVFVDDIDWNAPAQEIADRYHFRQEPGVHNAMASVKINFKNKHAVFMHDTPNKSLFKSADRYHSSGCVRVEDVHQLTSWVLAQQDGWDLNQIKSVAASQERVDVELKNKVKVHWVYLTAWAGPDGIARFRNDIYSLDGTGFITGQPEGIPEENAG